MLKKIKTIGSKMNDFSILDEIKKIENEKVYYDSPAIKKLYYIF